ncbi:dihydrolipoyl dehydrogenase family protein [Candidatus Margulisiibacteriota bacterium]
MKYDYHIIVIGAGSGGLVVASGAAGLGAKVALIEKGKMGGDCLNYGCVPSKTFLKSAHLAKDIKAAEKYGLAAGLNQVDAKNIMDRVQQIIAEIAPNDSKERYQGLGVNVINGAAKILDEHTVEVDNKKLTAKYLVISTGAKPRVPDIKGIENISYYTNETIFDLTSLPKHLIVIGTGPIGLELGQGFAHLGTQVSMVGHAGRLFPKDDPEVWPIMEKVIKDDGIKLYMNAETNEVRKNKNEIELDITIDDKKTTITGDAFLVVPGRVPDNSLLEASKIKIDTDKRGYIKTNPYLQTSVKNIYAVGDCTGAFQFTHMAAYQAGLVIRNTLFPFQSKLNYSQVPWTTYTKPEVAHVGYTQPWAEKEGLYQDSIIINLEDNDRAKSENDRIGFLKLILGKKSRLIGATMVGEKAGEIIPIATLAIKQKLKANAFMSLIFSYPTEAEIFKTASLHYVKKGFKPWMKELIRRVLL